MFHLPKIQAETPAEIVIANTLQAKSANTLGNEKIFCAEKSPKFIAVQNKIAIINPFFSPVTNVLAPDHFTIVVIKKPNAMPKQAMPK